MKILIATTNQGKLSEMLEVLGDLKKEFLTLSDLGLEKHDVPETGETYEENALIKAKYFAELSQLPTIGEDSGIIVDALANELGVQTRRWGAGKNASDQEWIDFFLERMKAFPNTRSARFISTAVFIDAKAGISPQYFVGETEGLITNKLEAPIHPGIPLSSCFIPVGADKVYSALSTKEKNQISHRGKAMMRLRAFLEKLNIS